MTATCSICFGTLEADLSATLCGHVFCTSCIRDWLQRGARTSCPLCKKFVALSDLTPIQYQPKHNLQKLIRHLNDSNSANDSGNDSGGVDSELRRRFRYQALIEQRDDQSLTLQQLSDAITEKSIILTQLHADAAVIDAEYTASADSLASVKIRLAAHEQSLNDTVKQCKELRAKYVGYHRRLAMTKALKSTKDMWRESNDLPPVTAYSCIEPPLAAVMGSDADSDRRLTRSLSKLLDVSISDSDSETARQSQWLLYECVIQFLSEQLANVRNSGNEKHAELEAAQRSDRESQFQYNQLRTENEALAAQLQAVESRIVGMQRLPHGASTSSGSGPTTAGLSSSSSLGGSVGHKRKHFTSFPSSSPSAASLSSLSLAPVSTSAAASDSSVPLSSAHRPAAEFLAGGTLYPG